MSGPTTPQLDLQNQQAEPQTSAQPQQAVTKKEDFTPQRTREAITKLPAALNGVKALMAKPWESFRAAFKSPEEADRTMQREITYTAQAMMANPYLVQCATTYPDEFVSAVKNVALSGLSLNPTLKQAYLVPFKGKVTFMPSYMGMHDLLSNTGQVKKVEAYPVFKGDTFEMEHGTNERLKHTPDPWGVRTKENLLGCYWIAELVDGTKLFNNMTFAEIEEIRKRSPSVGKGKSSPWDTDYIEMARKTCLRRGFKSLPKGSISDDRMRVVEAAFDYEEKVERNWIDELKKTPRKTDPFAEDAEDVEFEEEN